MRSGWDCSVHSSISITGGEPSTNDQYCRVRANAEYEYAHLCQAFHDTCVKQEHDRLQVISSNIFCSCLHPQCPFRARMHDRNPRFAGWVCTFLITLLERYTKHSDTLMAITCLDGTALDERIIKVGIDPGFKQGRQFGRGMSGGQVG